MTYDQRPDDQVTRALRAFLTPPGGDAYWDGFEARLLARLAGVDRTEASWFTELATWMRPAAVAAAVLVLLAGAAMVRVQQTETTVAYEEFLAPTPAPEAAPVETALRPTFAGEREVTLRFLINRTR